ncbi:tyrosine-type recombinase/integrase [Brevibacillus laterosporus]|uniref:tyrosine-type recombinase/integrase n=1 Tax=Brevibacillus laterosporus TaxID=1465 RepID=UPI000AE80A58|nr:tyrosine-type recombinase/integrase [Brevibacillus laterosporus]
MDKRKGKRQRTERFSVNSEYSLDALFERFYHAKVAEGRKDRTLASYKNNYGFFVAYMELRGLGRDVRNVSTEMIRGYIVWMLKEKVRFEGHKFKSKAEQTVGLAPKTVNTRLKPMQTFFKYLTVEDYISTNPFDSIKKVEENENEIKIMSIEQLQTLLAMPNQRRYSGFRDYVIMNVLIDGFFRINEVLSIRKTDIDFEVGMIVIRAEQSKNRKSRTVPISRHTLRLIKDIIKENEDFDTDYVFLANYGEPLRDGQFRHRLKEYAKQANIPIRIHPHLFRHTAATMFLENGGDLRHLQMILGHSDLRMVMRYTHLSKTSIKNQHEKYSPLNDVIGKLNKERKILR